MEYFTNGTGREVEHGKQRHAHMTGSAILCLALCFTVIAAALVIFTGNASATKGPSQGQVAGVQGVPAAQGTAPVPLNTGLAQPVQTGGISGAVATTGSSNGGGFPWWILIPVLLGMGAVAFVVARSRPAVEVVTAPGPPSQRPYTVRTTTTTTSVGPSVAAAGASTGAVGAAAPSQIVCPNCGASNDLNENFCHDCGQDLRSVRAQMLAPVVDVVDEYTPYLETQNRVDEQLEYVLSRALVTVGSAPGNDIVIDAAFNGSDTVGGVHAELRREGEGFVIADRGSETGVYVNGERVTEATLNDNDQVRIGDVQFVYRAPARP